MKNKWSALGFSNVSPEWVTEDLLETEIVILLQGNNMFGNRVYTYVKLLGKHLKEMFDVMKKGDNFKPSDFGTVIAAGVGDPPQEVRDEMREQYNMMDVPLPKQKVTFTSLQPKFFDDEST